MTVGASTLVLITMFEGAETVATSIFTWKLIVFDSLSASAVSTPVILTSYTFASDPLRERTVTDRGLFEKLKGREVVVMVVHVPEVPATLN